MIRHPLAVLALSLGLVLGASAVHGQFAISFHTIDGGGGTSSGGGFTLQGTIGQPDATGPLTGGPWSLTGGYWAGQGIVVPPSGYAAWAATNVPPGFDASFGGDFDEDGFPNGLVYVFGPEGIGFLGAGLLSPIPSGLPNDVELFLESSTDLRNWATLVHYRAGALVWKDPSILLLSTVLTHRTPDSKRFYRYRAELLP